MLTKIDLCSQALLKIGEKPITSFSEDASSAKLAGALYENAIDSLLCVHPWRFAKTKIALSKNSDEVFLIPSNVLRIISCDYEYEIMGEKIIANVDGILEIVAITRTTSELFPSYFSRVAATKLAMEFCIPLTGNQNTYAVLNAVYENELRTARFIDSSEGGPERIKNFPLISARF